MSGIKVFRLLVWAAIGALVGVLIAFNGLGTGSGSRGAAGSSGDARVGGPFELVSHTGDVVSDRTLSGRPYLVFFGFTFCPDICPTTLYELSDHMASLGPDADRFTPLFITVDPERDTQEVLAEYMTAFDDRIVALRGDAEATDKAVEAFSAYYAKVPLEDGGYTMDHTSGVLLMDSAGKFMGTLDIHEPRDTVLQKLRRLVSA